MAALSGPMATPRRVTVKVPRDTVTASREILVNWVLGSLDELVEWATSSRETLTPDRHPAGVRRTGGTTSRAD